MTRDELILLSAFTGTMLVPEGNFDAIHRKCEEALGRKIWTHEFAILSIQQEIKSALQSEVERLARDGWNNESLPLSLNKYQHLAQRTASASTASEHIENGVLGLCGESGEVADILKKHLYQKHDLDRDAMIDEAGDVLWYIAELATGLGITLEDIAWHNIEKLLRRYPNGFEADRGINRDCTNNDCVFNSDEACSASEVCGGFKEGETI